MQDFFRRNIQSKVRISDNELNSFFEKFKVQHYKKKEHLLHESKICRYYHFIVEGLVRVYHIDQKGKEQITSFAIENWWVTDLDSFVHQAPSKRSIQAIESTTTLAISQQDLHRSFQDIPVLNTFFRLLHQNMLIAIQRRYDFYLQREGKERYSFFMQHLNSFAQRIPQYMLASYLGVTPEYLSEIRKNK